MKKVLICAPANRFTGGPTLAHQLCKCLIEKGIESKMLYYHCKKDQPLVHPGYEGLGLPYTKDYPKDESDIIVVVPETAPDILKHFSKATKVIWWMSVDNYFDKYLTSRRNKILNVGGLLKYNVFSKDNYHLAQSQYAIDFLNEKGIDNDHIFYLSDYVDDVFLFNKWTNTGRKDYVVYSPKRGIEFTQKIIDQNQNIKFIPLQNMSQKEMIEVMNESKLYIDFGNHPGKDRIPREAALCGCCIITSRSGSAKNNVDVCIPDSYKFDTTDSNLSAIKNKISEILQNYEQKTTEFNEYREKITTEKERFEHDTVSVFTKLCDV